MRALLESPSFDGVQIYLTLLPFLAASLSKATVVRGIITVYHDFSPSVLACSTHGIRIRCGTPYIPLHSHSLVAGSVNV